MVFLSSKDSFRRKKRRREMSMSRGGWNTLLKLGGCREVASQQCLLFLENMASFCAGMFKKGSRSMRGAGR